MEKEPPKYRVYALIHGPILPSGLVMGVDIKKMSFEEQESRGFFPVQYAFTDATATDGYRTYVTSLPFVDSVKIKSEYVAVCDINERDEKAALGGAFREFDRLCRYLSMANFRDVRSFNGGKAGGYLPYMYQITRVYAIGADGSEHVAEVVLRSGHVYLPNRPDKKEWRESKTEDFFQEISSFHDQTLEQAVKYLYRSSIGGMVLDSPEKIALDHIKSIEIVIDSLSKKETLSERLDDAAKIIGITDQEKEEIIRLWKARSDHGDIAHPSKYDQAERYPNQFPLPTNVNYPNPGYGWVAGDIVLRYFEYRRRVYRVDVDDPFDYERDGQMITTEGEFGQVNPMWESNHYFLHSRIGDKVQLMKKAVVALAQEIGISEVQISSEMGVREHDMQVIWLTVTQC